VYQVQCVGVLKDECDSNPQAKTLFYDYRERANYLLFSFHAEPHPFRLKHHVYEKDNVFFVWIDELEKVSYKTTSTYYCCSGWDAYVRSHVGRALWIQHASLSDLSQLESCKEMVGDALYAFVVKL
jgi:hypothetical protein